MKQYKVLKEFTVKGLKEGSLETFCVGTKVNSGRILNEEEFLLMNKFIELIETPKMEVVEGYSDCEDSNQYSFYPSAIQKVVGGFNSILIKNPSPEIKAILKAVQDKRAYERYTDDTFEQALQMRYMNIKRDMEIDKNINTHNTHKVLIIPIEESEENNE